MKRIFSIALVILSMASPASAQSTADPHSGPAVSDSLAAWVGRWEGSLEIEGGAIGFGLSVADGGALLDLPSAELYGYPSSSARVYGDSLQAAFAFGGGALTLTATARDGTARGSFRQGRDDGEAGGGEAGGALTMRRSEAPPDSGAALSFLSPGGYRLPGTLLEPPGSGAPLPPLVILHAGLGAADRDGNNYNVRGKNDALEQLAQALAERGVASYRYDKRGSGAATWLVRREEELSFEAWIRDLATAAAVLEAAGRYSGIWLLGLNDGAVVAAAAANERAALGAPVAGLIVACASAESALDAFRKAVEQSPHERRAEGEAIIAALADGRVVAAPSEFYAAAFRPSFQPYLIEAFRRDLKTELAGYGGPCLIAQGNMDMQATLADLLALEEAKPDAVVIMPPRMNHVLKDVSQDVEENLAAFSDPSYPISLEFVDSLVEWLGWPRVR